MRGKIIGGRSGKSAMMKKAIDAVFDENPHARVLIVSSRGNEVIEGIDFEEVKPLEIDGPKDKEE